MQWSGKNRAQEWHAPFENIDPYIVFEEDKWVCGICNKIVDKQLYKPDLMSPSLDHIVPLSKGGGHVRSNVQLAHLLCNIIKHNKSELAT
jgi:5-methylcytosine-specific restriction endonuclease McrA